jgi:uncharacterized protein YgiM (DUF1202 family)
MKRVKQATTEQPTVSNRQVIATGFSVNVRVAPGLTQRILGTVSDGESLKYYDTVTDADGVDWHEVSFNRKHGYICGKYSKLG